MKKTICIFDLDDTLVKTDAKIKVYHKETDDLLHALTPEQYNYFNNLHGHTLDFDDFNDLQILLAGDLMIDNVKILLAHSKHHPIGIITARSHLNSVLEFIYEKRLPIEENLVFVVNDENSGFFGNVAERKKQAFERLIGLGYTDFIYYDDNLDNLKSAKSLEEDYANIKIELHHVEN
jgi:hydroxymethylpyrimidine pyrophosphatase-like HAD family hydrolase